MLATMSSERATVAELESICDRRNCHWNDLFLVGESAYISREGDRTLPTAYEPLLLDDLAFAEKLPELLRRLDAVEFKSLEALRDKLAMFVEFRKLNDELYELLTQLANGIPPDDRPFSLQTDDFGEPCQSIHCEQPESLTSNVTESIRNVLASYTREWEVIVTTGPFQDTQTVARIFKDRCVHGS
jgi:hypothetical protein